MKIVFVALILMALFSCSQQTPRKESSLSTSAAEAKILGKATGDVQFRPSVAGIVMQVKVEGLTPNTTHGFHIHEKGRCEAPGYKSAGDHLNPGKHSHGSPSSSLKHLGDLGNIVANNKGIAEKEILMNDLKDVHEIIEKTVIVHDKADDFSSQPAGNAGDRIACGIIRLK